MCGSGYVYEQINPLYKDLHFHVKVKGISYWYYYSKVQWLIWTANGELNAKIWVCASYMKLCDNLDLLSEEELENAKLINNSTDQVPLHDFVFPVYDPNGNLTEDNEYKFLVCTTAYKDSNTSERFNGSTKQDIHKNNALNFLTVTGNSISITCLTATISIYGCLRKLQNRAGIILMNYMTAQALAQLLFQINDHFSPYKTLCEIIGALLHHVWLSTFTFLMIMSTDMVRVFQYEIQMHEDVISTGVACFTGWLVPLVVVAPALIVNFVRKDLFQYGGEATCWIVNSSGILYAFGVPVLVATVTNTICITFCIIKLCLHSHGFSQSSVKSKQLAIILKLFCLTEFTWLFGFLPYFTGIEEFWYPFVVLTTLQGLYIFMAFGLNKTFLDKMRQVFTTESERNSPNTMPMQECNSTDPKPALSGIELSPNSTEP